MLTVYGATRILGRIELEDGKLTGTNRGVQDVADAAVRRTGSAKAAYADLKGQTNGYMTIVEAPPPDGGKP